MQSKVIVDKFLVDRKLPRKDILPKIDSYKSSKRLEYKLEPNERRIVEDVERTHPQLGGLTLFALMVAQLRKLGMITIMTTGGGKSTVSRSLERNVKGIDFLRVDGGITPAGVKSKPNILETLKRCITVADDVETFTQNSTSMESFLMISQLMESGKYMGYNLAMPVIKQADIGFIGGGTYNAISTFIGEGVFSSHIKERFIRMYYSYYNVPLGKNGLPLTKDYLPSFNYTYSDVDLNSVDLEVSTERMKRVIGMFKAQFGENRATVYSKRLLKVHAWFNGRKKADDRDADFYLMFKPFLEIEQFWIFKPIKLYDGFPISGGSIFGNVYGELLTLCSYRPTVKEEIKMRTNYSEEAIEKILRQLEKSKFIERDGNILTVSGKYRDEIENFHRTFAGQVCEHTEKVIPIITKPSVKDMWAQIKEVAKVGV